MKASSSPVANKRDEVTRKESAQAVLARQREKQKHSTPPGQVRASTSTSLFSHTAPMVAQCDWVPSTDTCDLITPPNSFLLIHLQSFKALRWFYSLHTPKKTSPLLTLPFTNLQHLSNVSDPSKPPIMSEEKDVGMFLPAQSVRVSARVASGAPLPLSVPATPPTPSSSSPHVVITRHRVKTTKWILTDCRLLPR